MGASINYVDKQGERRGHPNVNDTTYGYVVNLSAKWDGDVKIPQDTVNVVNRYPQETRRSFINNFIN